MARYLPAALWLLCWLAPLDAATLERLSLDDMIQKSTAIVRGRIGGPYSSMRGDVVYTHYPVEVSETFKGDGRAVVDLMLPGGTAGNVHQVYSGMAHLVEGREYVLFLWTGKSGITQLIGFSQGVFELPKSASSRSMAVQQTTSATIVDASSRQVLTNYEGIRLRLSDLRTRVLNVATGAGK
jgi:hypothetical protein